MSDGFRGFLIGWAAAMWTAVIVMRLARWRRGRRGSEAADRDAAFAVI